MIDAKKIMFGLDEALTVYLGLNKIWVNKPYDAELEYLLSNGKLYIETGILNAANVVVDMKMSGLGTDVLNGVEPNTSNKYKWGIGGAGNPYIGYGSVNNNYNYGTAVTIDDVFVYHIERELLTISDTSGNILSSSTAILSNYATSPIILFRMKRTGTLTTTNGIMRIYYCTITIDGVAHEFIPVRVGSVGYIYDKYNKLLLENIGTENFILGPEILS